MSPHATIRTLLLFSAATAAAAAQTATSSPAKTPSPATATARKAKARAHTNQPPFNPNVILLDPAHGGSDNGANLGSTGLEKDFTAAFAERLRGLLAAQNFTVVLTHAASTDETAPDNRVETANRSRAVACILLHASNAGHGVHLFTSALTEPSAAMGAEPEGAIQPWDSAQAASLTRSLQLQNELATSLNGVKVPLVVGRVSVSPIDSMTCPAVAIEIAPARANATLSDEGYLGQVAQSIVTALGYWREHAEAQIAAANPAAQPSPSAPAIPAPKPRPRPKPAIAPEEEPLAPDASKPAPIERRPPAAQPQPRPTAPPPAVPQ